MARSGSAKGKVACKDDARILSAVMNHDKHHLMELLEEQQLELSSQPLNLAINLQNLDIARILLRYGASMTSTGSPCIVNSTALHCAVISRQKAIIRKLLEKKVDWRASDGNGATVLHMVFELDEMPTATERDSEDDDDDEDEEDEDEGEEDEDEGEGEGDGDDGRRRRTKIPKNDSNVEQEIMEIITIFLNIGAKVNAETSSGESPLFMALKRGMIEVAGFLIERGANVHVRDNLGNSLIHLLINDELDENVPESYAQKNNATFVAWLLSKGVSPDYKNALGQIPMQLAVEYKLRDTLLVLLKQANVGFVNDHGEGWLHVFLKMYQAAEAREDFLTLAELNDVVRGLLKRGAPVNGVDCYGQTLFHAAIQLRNPQILAGIVDAGFVNVHACNSENESVLHALVSRCIDDERSAEASYAQVARALLARGASADRKDKRGMSALHLAAQYKYANIVRAFKDGGADLRACTDDGDSLVHIAAGRLSSVHDDEEGQAIVAMAVERGCDLDLPKAKGGWAPLHIAASSGNLRVARSLLEHGARLDCRNDDLYTPIDMAVMRDSREMVELLLSHTASAEDKRNAVNSRSRDTSTPLHLAVKNGTSGVVECLLEHGADANCWSDDFATPLHLATLGRCARTLELLVAGGADLEALDKNGLSPLLWLCNASSIDLAVAARLLELGADVGRRDPRDQASPMHVLVRRRQPKQLLALLARHGAQVDAQTVLGDTALHEAARIARIDDPTIPALLELGSRTQLRNAAGHTPLHCAVLANCSYGFYLLLKFAVGIHDIPDHIRSLVMASREMSSYMISHLAKLHSANLPTHGYDEAYDAGVNNDCKYKQEVEALRACTIDEQVSLYDLLHMQPDLRLFYLGSKSFDLADLETRFPHYYGFVWRLSQEARERKLIVKPAKRAFKELISKVRLPQVCAQLIFSYLDNECLKNIIEAAKR